MSDKKQFYELGQFLGGFFHQDWAVVFDWKGQEPNFETIVRSYSATDTARSVNKVKEELKHLLTLRLTDSQLENLICNEFGVAYNPARRGTTYRQWLERIMEILEEPSNSKNAMEFVGGASPQSIGLDLDALGFPRINQK